MKNKKFHIALVCNTYSSVINFRIPFIQTLKHQGFDVTVMVAQINRDQVKYLETILAVNVLGMPFGRGYTSPLMDAMGIIRLALFIKKMRFDLVVSFMIKPIFISFLSSCLTPSRRANIFEGLGYLAKKKDENFVFSFIVRSLFKLMTKKAKNVALNASDVDFLRSLGAREIHMLPGVGVQLNNYSLAARREKVTKIVRVGFAGRLIRSKGIILFLQAAKIICQKYQHVEFHVFGSTDENPGSITIDELIAMSEKSSVQFHGNVNLSRSFADIDILAIPSEREGFSVVLMEAFASGVPVVGSNVPGVQDGVDHDKNGLLFEKDNLFAFVEQLTYLIDNPSEVVRMGRAALNTALENFDSDDLSNRLCDILLQDVPSSFSNEQIGSD